MNRHFDSAENCDQPGQDKQIKDFQIDLSTCSIQKQYHGDPTCYQYSDAQLFALIKCVIEKNGGLAAIGGGVAPQCQTPILDY